MTSSLMGFLSTVNMPPTPSPTICLVSVQSQPNHKSFLKYFYRTYYNTKQQNSVLIKKCSC